MKPILPTIFITFLASTLLPLPALTATIYVPADQPTIQAGIDTAVDGDLVLVDSGTYVENIDFLCKNITLQSEEGADFTVIDGNQNGSVVTIDCNEEVIIDGFAIKNGSGTYFPEDGCKKGGGIFCNYSSATIINCTISDNILIAECPVGGGIYGSNASSLTIDNCTITENSAFYPPESGGGVNGSGGGVCCKRSSIFVTNSTITKNRIGNNGGGLWCIESIVSIDNCTISENKAQDGGGISLGNCPDPPSTITNCTISGNIASDAGGGIRCHTSPFSINNCSITDNIALGERGAALGGAIQCISNSHLAVISCTFSGNVASSRPSPYDRISKGGAIYFSGSCHAIIKNCIFSENRAENSSEALGRGGMFYSGAANLTILNCTAVGNSAAAEGGALYFDDASHTIRNCIFFGNTAPVGPEIFLYGVGSGHGASLEASYSDVQGGEASVHIEPGGTLHWLDGNIDEDPLFAEGTDYRLSAESPCIDTGDPAPAHSDQCFPPSMGTSRNDMGAYGGPEVCGRCGDQDGDGYDSDVCGGDDCDYTYFYTYPGADEICDGKDNDCDGTVLEDEVDSDGDGWMVCEEDCDDSNPETFPFAKEICDGMDNDCDGILPEEEADDDGDGWMICTGDCNDTDSAINPEVKEICEGGIDDDCDGLVDAEDWGECPILEVEAIYRHEMLNLDFRLTAPAYENWWSTKVILTSPTFLIIPLWTGPLPCISSPVDISISFPFPNLGWVGILTSLTTLEGDRADDLEWVYTG